MSRHLAVQFSFGKLDRMSRTSPVLEGALIEARKSQFPLFLAEREPVLVDFAERLGFAEPHRILNEPSLFLPGLDTWLQHQEVSSDDYMWLLARLAYFIGEYLVVRFSGSWFVNGIEGSRYFGRYVVGNFAKVSNRYAQVDPYEIGADVLKTRPPTSLEAILNQVVGELEAA